MNFVVSFVELMLKYVWVFVLFSGRNSAAKEQLDNQQNSEAQRERYYATIHKVALQAGEKIPGSVSNDFN